MSLLKPGVLDVGCIFYGSGFIGFRAGICRSGFRVSGVRAETVNLNPQPFA